MGCSKWAVSFRSARMVHGLKTYTTWNPIYNGWSVHSTYGVFVIAIGFTIRRESATSWAGARYRTEGFMRPFVLRYVLMHSMPS